MVDNNKGFTIIEILIALVISTIVGGAIAMLYQSQTRIKTTQSLITGMNQNIRTALYFLENEIQMAGYTPKNDGIITAGIISPQQAASITFTYVADEDGFDNDNDGITDANDFDGELATIQFLVSGENLIRRDVTHNDDKVIVNNIENIEFIYKTNPDSSVTVDVSLLAKTSRALPDRHNTGNQTYTTPSGTNWNISTDLNNGRQLFTASVLCRNIGL